MPILYFLEELLVIMAASIIGNQTSKESSIYPPGYETSTVPVWDTYTKSPSVTQPNIYPKYQNSLVFSLIIKEIQKVSTEFTSCTSNIIDKTEDDIEPDTPQAIAKLEKEVEKLTYEIAYYEEELERLEKGLPPRGAKYTPRELSGVIAEINQEIEDLRQDIETLKYGSLRTLTDTEKDKIKIEVAEKMVKIKEEQLEKTKHCNCSITPYIKPNIFRRNMSDLSADYQATIAGSTWDRTKNPKTGIMSVEIKEWLYDGPTDKVEFDGWLREFCLLLEMKASYDRLMFSRSQSLRMGKPVLKQIGISKMDSLCKQAERHNKVCLMHPPAARCCWVFMTPMLYDTFLEILNLGRYPAITAILIPLP